MKAETVFSTEFHIDKKEKLNKALILPSTEPLLPQHSYENLTDCEPDPLGEGLLCFGTVIDGKIVSLHRKTRMLPTAKSSTSGSKPRKALPDTATPLPISLRLPIIFLIPESR